MKLKANKIYLKFQFHKGAIGVTYLLTFSKEGYTFQFHKGAIGVFAFMGLLMWQVLGQI